jgi:hypothetical protein
VCRQQADGSSYHDAKIATTGILDAVQYAAVRFTGKPFAMRRIRNY